MKYIKILIFSAALGSVAGAGCNTDELKGLNVNPQALDNIDVNFLFSSAQLGAASGGSAGDNRYIDWRTNINFAGHAIQQLASLGGPLGEKYVETGSTFESNNAPFEFIYGDQLKNIGEILKQTGPGGFAEGEKQNMRNAARILRVFLFHRLTDYYGNVPYFETMSADSALFFPRYDKQQDIYQDLFKELDEAIAALTTEDPADGFAAADMYYDGDLSKWRKWGYSLMLRLAMRVSNVQPEWANTYVAKAVAGGVFASNDDNTVVPMAEAPSVWTNQNGISRAFIPGDGGVASESFLSDTLIDILKGPNATSVADDDPRLMIFSGGIGPWEATGFTPTVTDPLLQKGLPNGYDQNSIDVREGFDVTDDLTYSRVNPLLLDRADPYLLMGYGEVELLLAEASERSIGGLTPAGAEAHYNAGVKASIQQWVMFDPSLAVPDAEVDAYLAANPYGSKPKLQQIGEQLWLHHFMNWWEAWSEWRRTGFPALTPVNYAGNATGGQIPQRLLYPNAEVAGNPNFASGATQNDYTTKVWWAGGPG